MKALYIIILIIINSLINSLAVDSSGLNTREVSPEPSCSGEGVFSEAIYNEASSESASREVQPQPGYSREENFSNISDEGSSSENEPLSKKRSEYKNITSVLLVILIFNMINCYPV